MSNSRIHPCGACADDSLHFVQCLVLPSSGSEPVGAVKKILLIDGVQYFHHRLLRDLSSRAGIEIGLCFPFSFGM